MIREDLSNLSAYVPGKRMPDALKLSSNEMTTPPLETAVQAMAAAAAGVNRYPDMNARDVRVALADHLGVSPTQVTVGCGSSALCQQLVQATCLPGDEVVFAWRSFEAYPIFTKVCGATPVTVPLTDDYRHDLPAMAAAITDKTQLVFVCNPNNPTGTTITKEEFRAFMDAVPERVIVALDEAYFEYVRETDTPIATELIGSYPNLVGLRTFSKAYGLAGTRIGYAFGNKEIITALDKVAIPFSVNAVAQAGALASLAGKEELHARTDITVAARETFIRTIPGAVSSEANFVWIPAAHCGGDALARAQALTEKGVLVRAFPDGIRVTVTNDDELQVFTTAWK